MRLEAQPAVKIAIITNIAAAVHMEDIKECLLMVIGRNDLRVELDATPSSLNPGMPAVNVSIFFPFEFLAELFQRAWDDGLVVIGDPQHMAGARFRMVDWNMLSDMFGGPTDSMSNKTSFPIKYQ
jgi:hypothetical protein